MTKSGLQTAPAILISVLLMGACASVGEPPSPPAPDPAPAPAPVSAPQIEDLYAVSEPADYNLSCAELFELMKVNQPTSLEELLQSVQKVRPKFLSRVVFAYETKMAYDGASLLHPRAVVYGGDAKTILNFAGHRRQKFYDRMELMCFNDAENRFEFNDIAFPKEETAAEPTTPEATAALTAEEKNAKYVVIPGGRGVRTCTHCHQSPARPNWDTAPLWPGFFGAADDALKDRNRSDKRNIYNSFEARMWERFQSVARNGRYRFVTQELIRPNSDFTLKLSYLNGRRIIGDLKRLGPDFEKQRYAFAKALMCTPRAERKYFRQITGDASVGSSLGVLPLSADASAREIFLSSYFDEMHKERRLGAVLAQFQIPNPLPKERFEELRKYYRNLLDPRNELNLDLRLSSVDVDEVLLVAELKRVTDRFKIDIENWSMVREGGFVHENGRGGDGRIALRLILERPFTESFLVDDKTLMEAIRARQDREIAFERDRQNMEAQQSLKQASERVCELIDQRLKKTPSP